MKYWYSEVARDLKEYVQTVLILESSHHTASSDLPIFTSGMPALLCNSNTSAITLFGEAVPPERLVAKKDDVIIIYFFKPFMLATIFNRSAKELKRSALDLNRLNAVTAMALNVQLFHSESLNDKIVVLNNFIQSQLETNKKECRIIQYATDQMMKHSNAEILTQLLEELNLNERTFQRIFKKYVGITPSQYRRICQFYFTFSQLKGGHFDKQTDVAYTNGYFDQSHYIRAFKEFTDTTPNEYLKSGLRKKKS